jgi:hypothetical protein
MRECGLCLHCAGVMHCTASEFHVVYVVCAMLGHLPCSTPE